MKNSKIKTLSPMTDEEIDFQIKLVSMVDGDSVEEWEEESLYLYYEVGDRSENLKVVRDE
jgi:hypothetical protein